MRGQGGGASRVGKGEDSAAAGKAGGCGAAVLLLVLLPS